MHDRIFCNFHGSEKDSGDEDDTGHPEMMALVKEDLIIPFPRERHCNFSRELIHVFGWKVLVTISPASGMSMLAAIMENIKGVGVCMSQAHKTFVYNQLLEKVKARRLCSVTPPPKPQELLAWESKTKAQAAATMNSPATGEAAAKALPHTIVPKTGSVPPPAIVRPAVAVSKFGAQIL